MLHQYSKWLDSPSFPLPNVSHHLRLRSASDMHTSTMHTMMAATTRKKTKLKKSIAAHANSC